MPTKKASKKSTPRKAAASRVAGKKRTGTKPGKKRRSPDLISTAQKVVRTVVASAASGAATALKGAVAAASKAAGVGEGGKRSVSRGRGKSKS